MEVPHSSTPIKSRVGHPLSDGPLSWLSLNFQSCPFMRRGWIKSPFPEAIEELWRLAPVEILKITLNPMPN